MYVIVVRGMAEVERLCDFLAAIVEQQQETSVHSIRVGIDPLDSGVKFSVDYGTWSPPIRGQITK